ncbi:uncharacterized protein LOC117326180 isoform X3 [Pecten maximus]|uniref:uncharacterized protein LOC117326180 isoform X3 n=1 Tax=Pecten maximus TaxID=6579 RepID=UPI001457FBB9|nr:uncharacterized protein LOC117326180 isoform X3 [Pecten maximus]
MSQVRIKKRQWRPKPSDEPPKPRGKIRLIRLEPDPKVQKCSEKSQTKADVSQHAGFLRDPKVQKCSEKSQTKADVSQLAGFLRKRHSSETTMATNGTKSTRNMSIATKPESRASNVTMTTSGTYATHKPSDMVNTSLQDPKVQKCSEKSQTKADVSQLAGFLRDPKVQKCSEKSQTKADVSQLAGFLRKRHSPETTMATNGEKSTCNMTLAIKPESHASDVTITTGATCDKRILSDMVHISPQQCDS